MLTDFDLSKQSSPAGDPTVVMNAIPSMPPAIDTKACIANLRTNSFVGTEGTLEMKLCRYRNDPQGIQISSIRQHKLVFLLSHIEYIAPEVIKGTGHTSAVDWWTLGILMYEMLFGVTPFKGKDKNQTFHAVVTFDVQFPEHAGSQTTSALCKDVIRKLLIKDEQFRLGSGAGASDVKSHAFFKTTNWALLRHLTPPIVPAQSFGADAINFRKMQESMSLDMDHEELILQHPGTKNLFANFSSGTRTRALFSLSVWPTCDDEDLLLCSSCLPCPIVTLHHDGDDDM